ncbi:MAG: toll/interleukin-1 receptor domain-containing protein [Magnetococcales bacterium]|nr:toll/interleukin-1 receptor domain-containing protein [Magnetococcales bacterium]
MIQSLKNGFTRSAHAGSTLIIHVLHESLFDSLRSLGATAPMASRPRVFISHTPANDDDKEWVKELAVYLKARGIQARLDLLHLHRGMDLPQWMTNELSLADKVIIVCNEKYKQRSEGRLGGVGWETMIIQGDFSRLQPDSTKYQVVIRTEKIEDGLPIYLQTKYAFHARPSDGMNQFKDELVSELLDISKDEFESTMFVL